MPFGDFFECRPLCCFTKMDTPPTESIAVNNVRAMMNPKMT